MCGIVGQWSSPGAPGPQIERLSATLSHRGPDSCGAWSDPGRGVYLGHSRLAILDLSPAGAQPMTSASGRYVMTYNGEIYNHHELRAELEQCWAGNSDTETLLAAIERWGLEESLRRSVGMFALALWDRSTEELWLARDRLGQKPLYYGSAGGALLFASELKALFAHDSVQVRVDDAALALYLRFGFVPAPWCVLPGFKKLLPGSLLRVDDPRGLPAPRRYWDAAAELERGRNSPFQGTFAEATNRLEELLLDAVRARTISDVPIGALLSGGVDSSLVVALLQRLGGAPTRTFSIGFAESAYDEAQTARRVAAQLGTDHTELYVSAQDALDTIPELPTVADEPFADSSLIPTLLVCRLARQHVSVVLTGDGGDEVWAGYDRYLWGRRVWKVLERLPFRARQLGANALTRLSPRQWDALLTSINRFVPGSPQVRLLGHKVHKLAPLARTRGPESFHLALASLAWQAPVEILCHRVSDPVEKVYRPAPHGLSLVETMMLRDIQVGFPDDMLAKVDRASMAVSLEARVPLADHRIYEFAASLPLELKLRQGRTKLLLREVLYRHVDRSLIERPKMGFGVPVANWLRGPLRGWAEELLRPQALEDSGLDPAPITQAFQTHLSGRASLHPQLWAVLSFQAWRARWAA